MTSDLTERCPVCGIDPRSINPADAGAAVRSFPRRYRILLVRPDDEEGAGVVTRRPTPEGWSALEHAAHVADVARAVANALGAVRIHDDPPVDIRVGPPGQAPVDDVVDRLASDFQRLASVMDGFEGSEWQRTGRLPSGQQVTAIDLVRHAVHVGAHHRREIDRVMAKVR